MRPIVLTLVLSFAACGPAPHQPDVPPTRDPAVIEARMQEYVATTRTMDVEKMAAFYSPAAELFEPGIPPIVSHDSILAFMRFFVGAKVNSATVDRNAIELFDSTAFYWGTYHENLDFPGQPTSDQQGKFVAEWKLQSDGTWLIERLYRIPLPPSLEQ
ncbi:MAG: nuclear transport factor 2 family protein [Flavobacteriales bacterium]